MFVRLGECIVDSDDVWYIEKGTDSYTITLYNDINIDTDTIPSEQEIDTLLTELNKREV